MERRCFRKCSMKGISFKKCSMKGISESALCSMKGILLCIVLALIYCIYIYIYKVGQKKLHL